MKIGKRTHLDLGSIVGALLIFLGALPEIVSDPAVRAVLPAKWTPILLIVGAVLGAMRGRAVRVEQYRADDVVKAAVTGEVPASVPVVVGADAGKDETVERPKFPLGRD